jgi:hypothetical protein
MTSLFALRSKFFWPAMAICLLPFVILPFVNSLALDDYYYYELYRTRGFWGAQHDLYVNWAGRYTTSFITGSFIILDLPGRFPFLPTLIYFFATWSAIVYILRSLRPLLAAGSLPPGIVARAAAVLFVVFLYVQPDIATGFYWLSSTSVYQTAFILFLLLLGVILRKFGAQQPGATPKAGRLARLDLLFYLLILLLEGCNEIMAVLLPIFLFLLAKFFYPGRRRADRWVWMGLGIAVAMGLVIFATSGVMNYRQHFMNSHTDHSAILGITVFRTVEVFFYVLREPLFWGCAVTIYFVGVGVSPQLKEQSPLAFFRAKNIFLQGLTALESIVFLSLTAFLLASRGSMPPRVLNDLSDISACGLLALSFFAGIHKGAQLTTPIRPLPSPGIQTAALIVLLLASINYADAWKSVGSGYFYHAVLSDRDHALKTAAAGHRRVATVVSYDSTLTEKIRETFPHGVPITALGWLTQKPTLLVFFDGAADGDAAYAHFYGLDSIIVGPEDRRPKANH